jgi:formylglycine-generating enzyme required for sulfatase activity
MVTGVQTCALPISILVFEAGVGLLAGWGSAIHMLTFGYDGQGPTAMTAFLSAAGFVNADASRFEPPVIVHRDGKTTKGIAETDGIRWPDNTKTRMPMFPGDKNEIRPHDTPARPSGTVHLPEDLIEIADAQFAPLKGLAPGSREAQDRQRRAVVQPSLPLEVRTRKTGIILRLIPAGTFTMGSPSDEERRFDNEIQHQVTLTTPFYCGKFEVTQSQWREVMGTNPSHFTNVGGDAPVERVNWDDCREFVDKVCRMEKVAQGTYRLLTEAEWEYACRAGTHTPFAYETDLDSSMANFKGDRPYGRGRKGTYSSSTVARGSFSANAWGLYDMHGNVWEWCQDWHTDYAGDDATDPLGPASGTRRVNRGGCWGANAQYCRSAFRNGYSPSERNEFLGLRLARTAPSCLQ